MANNKLPAVFTFEFWLIVVFIILTVAFFLPDSCSPSDAADNERNMISTLQSSPYRIIAIGGTAIVALMFTIITQKFKQNNADLNHKIREIRQLSSELARVKCHNDLHAENYERLNRIYSDYFQTLDSLSSEYFEKNNAGPQVRMTIIRKLENELSRTQSEEFDETLFEWVNLNYNNVIQHIAEEMPQLKHADLKMIGLKVAHFSPKAISLILQITLGNYYNRWTRLRCRIVKSNALHKDMILNLTNSKRISQDNE